MLAACRVGGQARAGGGDQFVDGDAQGGHAGVDRTLARQ